MDSTSINKSKGKKSKKLPSYIALNERKVKPRQIKKDKNPPKMKKMRMKPNEKSTGRIYIGNIPHGFYEDEMTAYFNQFGKVLVAYVARSKKTGRSRGYGYVEFRNEDVAKIAAETMNNYLMYNKILKCRYIPPEERRTRLRPQTSILHEFPRQKNRKATMKIKNNSFKKLTDSSYSEKVQKKMKKFQEFFTDKGIEFTFQMNNVKPDTVEDNVSNKPVKGSESETSSENESDSQFGVLEIDESDTEIHFQTPPNVKKVIKKSTNTPASSQRKLEKEDKLKNKKKVCLMNDGNVSKIFAHKDSKKERKPLSKSQDVARKPQKKVVLKEGHSSKMFSQVKKNPNSRAEVMKSHVNKLSKSNKTNSKLSRSNKENKTKQIKMKTNRLIGDKNSKKPMKRKS